jgi:hypothetical protein
VGTHTITLTATDSDGWVVTDQITFTITAAATAIEVQMGATASSSVAVSATAALPIVVDMTNAAGRNVAAITLKITWNASVASYQSATPDFDLVINKGWSAVKNEDNVATGELILTAAGPNGEDATFTVWNLSLVGASAGATVISVEVTTIRDEDTVSHAGVTGTRNHTLTVTN